jgi:hypothetical protein
MSKGLSDSQVSRAVRQPSFISMTLSLEELSGRLARSTRGPGVALTGRIVQLLPSSDHAHATIVPMSSVPERSAASRADVLANCSDR